MTSLYRDTVALIRVNGYAPSALEPGQNMPLGAWAVRQTDYSSASDQAIACVLTSCRPARIPFTGVIVDPASTWLGMLRVGDVGDLAPKVEAIIANHIGKCPVRVDEDGPTVRPFRVSGAFRLASHDDSVCIECGLASFIRLDGEWRGGSPLTVAHSDLPELNEIQAEALMDEINALLDQRTPMPSFKPTSAPPPAPLPRAEALHWSDTPAIDKLRADGYRPERTPLGVPDGWKRSLFAGVLRATDQGVGIHTAPPLASYEGRPSEVWLVTLTVKSSVRELHDLISQHIGRAPVRVASDGTLTYVLRQEDGHTWRTVEFMGDIQKKGIPVRDTFSTVRVESDNRILPISGLDARGKPFQWRGGDLLTTRRADLPPMNASRAQNLIADIRRLFERLSLARAS